MKQPNLPLMAALLATAGGCAATGSGPAATVDGQHASVSSDTATVDTAPPPVADTASVARAGEPGSGVVFHLRYRMPADMVCSHDRATGSHFEKEYCRSEAMARQERDAAREFLMERMRDSL